MTCQATGCTATGTTITLGANATGGTLVVGMTVTWGAQTQPVTPAIRLTALVSGGGSTSGSQWTTSSATGIGGGGTTLTFTAANPPANIMEPLPAMTMPGTMVPVQSLYAANPPAPLPETLVGSTTQTSYST